MIIKSYQIISLLFIFFLQQAKNKGSPEYWLVFLLQAKNPMRSQLHVPILRKHQDTSKHSDINPKLILLPVKGTSCFQEVLTIPYQQRPARAQSHQWNPKGYQTFDSGQDSNSSSLGLWRWPSLVIQRQLRLHQDFTIQEAIHFHSDQFIPSNPLEEYDSTLIKHGSLLEKYCIHLDAFPHQTLYSHLETAPVLPWGFDLGWVTSFEEWFSSSGLQPGHK